MSPTNVETTCPMCGIEHDDRYDDTSDWCRNCAEQALHEQTEDLPIGETFG